MHFTEPVYRHPYWPTWPLIEITQGCSHNRCEFCTMYRDVRFGVQPIEVIESDLDEIAQEVPRAKTIQLLSGDPLALPYSKLVQIMEKIHEYLPDIERVYAVCRVDNFRNKTVDELKRLHDLGLEEVSLGIESGDDWTLDRVNKGYLAKDVAEQCAKLDEAGIKYWLTFMNGIAGREHSHDHAVHTAEVFNRCNPSTVYITSLVLFPGTPLLADAERGAFDPLSEKNLLVELRTFLEHLDADCALVTHHTASLNLSTPDFLRDKERILAALDNVIENGDIERLALKRRLKTGL